MKPLLVYAYAGERYLDYASRFVSCYNAFPPGEDHDSLIVCNGVPADFMVQALFGSLANVSFVQHDNSGWDIGAFQFASAIQPPRIALFLGASSHMNRPGWMKRVVESTRRGLGLYGSMENSGDERVRVFPHIRTTGFWLNTDLFNRYPLKVTSPGQRYEFEHGRTCLTEWCKQQGYMPWSVGWDGEYPPQAWGMVPNGFHRGDQSNLIFKDRLAEPPYY